MNCIKRISYGRVLLESRILPAWNIRIIRLVSIRYKLTSSEENSDGEREERQTM